MAMGHSSNYQMKLNYTTSSEPIHLSLSINNDLPQVSFETEVGVSYEIYNSSSLISVDDEGWNLVYTITADSSITSIIGSLEHDNQFWYVKRTE
jgi:hypothetical protein